MHAKYYIPQIVLINNCSTDNTLALAKSFLLKNSLDWTLISTRTNREAKPALNLALAQFPCDYFVYLSGDDFVHANRFDAQISAVAGLPESVVMVGGSAVRTDQGGRIIPHLSPISMSRDFQVLSLRSCLFEPGGRTPHVVTQLLRRSALDAIGGYPTDLPFDDIPVNYLLGLIPGSLVANVPDAVTYYRQHPGASSNLLQSKYLVFLYSQLLKRRDLLDSERLVLEARRATALVLSEYEASLLAFARGDSGSRRTLLRKSLMPGLHRRGRWNCLALSLVPLWGRRRARTRYREGVSALLGW